MKAHEAPIVRLLYIESVQPRAILPLNQKRADTAIEDPTPIDYAR